MKLQLAKGVRDIAPKDKILKNDIVKTLQDTFESFGYNPLETPILERESVLTSKFTGGEDILKEMFILKDQGKRKLGLRYDLTVPFSRYIGMNPQLKIPFRRYQIGKVFRDGPIKLGRYREFWQCDVDIMGIRGMSADAEILAVTDSVLKNLNLKTNILVNNRKLLNGVLYFASIPEELYDSVILSLDKLEKFGWKIVNDELEKIGVKPSSIKKIKKILSIEGSNNQKISQLKGLLSSDSAIEGISELEELFGLLKVYGTKVVFDISLARGLAYYTGTVFEVFLVNSKIKSAISGGGRYDDMIGNLLDSKKCFPAVGISFGLDVLSDALESDKCKAVAELFILPIQTKDECIKLAQELRKEGIKVSLDIIGRGISKNLDYANVLGIPFVLFVGPDELKKKSFKLRDMFSGEEKLVSLNQLKEKFK